MLFSQQSSFPSSLTLPELEATFKTFIGAHDFEQAVRQYDLIFDYDRYILMRKDCRKSGLEVASYIKLKTDGETGSRVQVKTQFTEISILILVFVHIILIATILFVPNLKLFRTYVIENLWIRFALLFSQLTVFNTILWLVIKVRTQQHREMLREIFSQNRIS